LRRTSVFVTAFVTAAWTAFAAGTVAVRAQSGQLVTDFELSESAFSPDGDGNQESTTVSYSISEDSPALSIVVFEDDSVTVVDTLVAPGAASAGSYTVVWHGTYSGGGAVPEGLYLVALAAQGTALPDTSITLPVAVDNTPPAIQILLSEPGIYAPGLEGTPQVYGVTFIVSGSSATYGIPSLADQLALDITAPNGADVQPDTFISIVPKFEGVDGTYELRWDANLMQTVSDGYYQIDFTVTDQAGHAAMTADRPKVDKDVPKVRFTNVADGDNLIVVPDSLYGWAWDLSGIDSLYVKYSDTTQYNYITDTAAIDDTTFFAVPLADSLAAEGSYRIRIRAKDAVTVDIGRVSTPSLSIRVDRSAPAAPTLEPFDGAWRTPTFTLRGDWTDDPDLIRIHKNGVQIDSVFTILKQSLVHDVTLDPGVNVLSVTAVDGAGNESPHSNQVRVEFDNESGLYIPAPFYSNDKFQLNLARAAAAATLRIYDMAGDLVVVLNQPLPAQNYVFVWDGLNGDGTNVKRGPLVAVAEADNNDGKTVIFREIFLFAPSN
jgi:flagellar hook assembly protein FlgD